MANSKIKTRILLRNDTLENWGQSTLGLAKGEVAIATDATGNVAEIRVGTGSSTWAQALKLTVASSQVTGLKEYRTNSNGLNKWDLQARGIGEDDSAWKTVTTIDMSAISNYALSTDVTKAINDAKSDLVSKTEFQTLSAEIGLDKADKNNKVVT